MSGARHHHHVPQFYLRGFANGIKRQARVHVIDVRSRRSFTTVVRNIGGRRDFNRVELEHHDPNVLEREVGKLEHEAADVIRQTDAAQTPPEGKQRETLLKFIALLAARNPRLRDNLSEFLEDIVKRVGQLTVSTPERWKSTVEGMKRAGHDVDESIPYEQVRSFARRGQYHVEVNQTYLIGLEAGGVDAVFNALAPRNWLLAVAPDGSDFITTDHPVVLRWTDEKLTTMSPGFGMRSTVVLFPISRRLLWMGQFEGTDLSLSVTRDFVARANSILINSAERQVYSFDESFPYFNGIGTNEGRDFLSDPQIWRRGQKKHPSE